MLFRFIFEEIKVADLFINGEMDPGNTNVWFDLDTGQVIFAPANETTVATILTLAISSIGIGFSAVALALLLLTAMLFAEWRQIYKNQLLIQFISARFIYVIPRYFNNVSYVFGLYELGLKTIFYRIFILLYTEVAFVFWMFIFSKQLYTSLVKVFNANESHMIRDSLLAWALPIVISFLLTLLISVLEDSYILIHCLYFFILKWPLLISNAVLLFISLRSVLKTKTRARNNRKTVFVMIGMIFAFCFQQLFMDIYMIVYVSMLRNKVKIPESVNAVHVALNIFALYQCAASAVFWVFGNAKTRELWKFIPKNQRVISQISSQNQRMSTKL